MGKSRAKRVISLDQISERYNSADKDGFNKSSASKLNEFVHQLKTLEAEIRSIEDPILKEKIREQRNVVAEEIYKAVSDISGADHTKLSQIEGLLSDARMDLREGRKEIAAAETRLKEEVDEQRTKLHEQADQYLEAIGDLDDEDLNDHLQNIKTSLEELRGQDADDVPAAILYARYEVLHTEVRRLGELAKAVNDNDEDNVRKLVTQTDDHLKRVPFSDGTVPHGDVKGHKDKRELELMDARLMRLFGTSCSRVDDHPDSTKPLENFVYLNLNSDNVNGSDDEAAALYEVAQEIFADYDDPQIRGGARGHTEGSHNYTLLLSLDGMRELLLDDDRFAELERKVEARREALAANAQSTPEMSAADSPTASASINPDEPTANAVASPEMQAADNASAESPSPDTAATSPNSPDAAATSPESVSLEEGQEEIEELDADDFTDPNIAHHYQSLETLKEAYKERWEQLEKLRRADSPGDLKAVERSLKRLRSEIEDTTEVLSKWRDNPEARSSYVGELDAKFGEESKKGILRAYTSQKNTPNLATRAMRQKQFGEDNIEALNLLIKVDAAIDEATKNIRVNDKDFDPYQKAEGSSPSASQSVSASVTNSAAASASNAAATADESVAPDVSSEVATVKSVSSPSVGSSVAATEGESASAALSGDVVSAKTEEIPSASVSSVSVSAAASASASAELDADGYLDKYDELVEKFAETIGASSPESSPSDEVEESLDDEAEESLDAEASASVSASASKSQSADAAESLTQEDLEEELAKFRGDYRSELKAKVDEFNKLKDDLDGESPDEETTNKMETLSAEIKEFVEEKEKEMQELIARSEYKQSADFAGIRSSGPAEAKSKGSIPYFSDRANVGAKDDTADRKNALMHDKSSIPAKRYTANFEGKEETRLHYSQVATKDGKGHVDAFYESSYSNGQTNTQLTTSASEMAKLGKDGTFVVAVSMVKDHIVSVLAKIDPELARDFRDGIPVQIPGTLDIAGNLPPEMVKATLGYLNHLDQSGLVSVKGGKPLYTNSTVHAQDFDPKKDKDWGASAVDQLLAEQGKRLGEPGAGKGATSTITPSAGPTDAVHFGARKKAQTDAVRFDEYQGHTKKGSKKADGGVPDIHISKDENIQKAIELFQKINDMDGSESDRREAYNDAMKELRAIEKEIKSDDSLSKSEKEQLLDAIKIMKLGTEALQLGVPEKDKDSDFTTVDPGRLAEISKELQKLGNRENGNRSLANEASLIVLRTGSEIDPEKFSVASPATPTHTVRAR